MMQTRTLCRYPIAYLQDKLLGITTESLVIFACASGSGKSTISRILMQGAREQGCPAVLYSLEDTEGSFATDAVRRVFMKETGTRIDLLDFSIDNTENPERYKEYRLKALQQARETTADGLPLQVVHESVARNDWSVKKLAASITQEVAKGYKLFIVDHLDVLVPSESVSEMAQTMNELWALCSEQKIAIITFSQLSSARLRNSLCPSLDDLRGSRAKGFKATTVITLAKHLYGYYALPAPNNRAQPTYMRVVKQRGKGTSCAVVFFDNGRYLDFYQEVECNESGTYIDGMTQEKLQKYKDKQ